MVSTAPISIVILVSQTQQWNIFCFEGIPDIFVILLNACMLSVYLFVFLFFFFLATSSIFIAKLVFVKFWHM